MTRSYHEATKHSQESVRRGARFLDWETKPFPFKAYEGLSRVEFPSRIPGAHTGALATLRGVGRSTPPTHVDIVDLARLLFLSAGVVRTKDLGGGQVVHFRTYASAGALYPVEVYAACGPMPGLDAGLYHFDPRHFALLRLREGDQRAALVRASAEEPAVAGAQVVLVLTGIPWRTGWKYGERGYRHLFWDAGMILANLLAAGGASGLSARVVLGFADQEVETLLGIDGRRELPLCLVPVGGGDRVEPPGRGPESARFHEGPMSRAEHEFELIREASDGGRLALPGVEAWRAGGAGSTASSEPVAEPLEEGPDDPLEAVIRRRGSARWFGRGTMPAGTLRAILDLAGTPIATDYAPAGSRLIERFLVVNGVEGLFPGAYLYADRGPELLRTGRFRRVAGHLCLDQRLAADAAAVAFLMTDLDRVLGRLGDRGYRAAQLEGGIVAGRIYLAAYAHRFGATGLTFYDDEVTEFFSPPGAGKSCMLVVAVGESPRLSSKSSMP
jgi:SagB-type dehydrogenase family enzyme